MANPDFYLLCDCGVLNNLWPGRYLSA